MGEPVAKRVSRAPHFKSASLFLWFKRPGGTWALGACNAGATVGLGPYPFLTYATAPSNALCVCYDLKLAVSCFFRRSMGQPSEPRRCGEANIVVCELGKRFKLRLPSSLRAIAGQICLRTAATRKLLFAEPREAQ